MNLSVNPWIVLGILAVLVAVVVVVWVLAQRPAARSLEGEGIASLQHFSHVAALEGQRRAYKRAFGVIADAEASDGFDQIRTRLSMPSGNEPPGSESGVT
jgi:hypothetical protein